jgi:hypothetical protein
MEGGTLTVANGTLSLNVAQGGFGTADTGGLGEGGDLVEQLEPHPLATPLQPIAVACVVDQDPLHRFRRGGEEVPLVAKVLVADQPQVDLVHQRRRLERLPRGHAGHAGAGKRCVWP